MGRLSADAIIRARCYPNTGARSVQPLPVRTLALMDVAERDYLLQRFESVFEAARVLVLTGLAASGSPVLVPAEHIVVTPREDGSGWRSARVATQANVLSTASRPELEPMLEPWASGAFELASELNRRFEDSLPPAWVFAIRGRWPGCRSLG